jgi:predicted DsbA family dithiol-disulfide isomerase
MVEACGYRYDPPADVVPSSRKALQVTELARDHGLHDAVHTRLMDAYWSEGANIGVEETLLDLVAGVGVPRDEAATALADGRYLARIQQSTREAQMVSIHAIPAFVLDNRMLLVGAYPHEVFERAIGQLTAVGEDGA